MKILAFYYLLLAPSSQAFQTVPHRVRISHSFLGVAKDTDGSSPSKQPGREPILEPFGKGIKRDFKARRPYFKSDIKDGVNAQCLAATIFLFFACLSPAIAFGSIYSSISGGAIGTVETLLSSAAGGVVYSLLAAQPMTIIGSTGQVLAFAVCLASLAKNFGLPFLPLYAWTGLWTSGILLGISATSGSNIVRYLTRFTDEIFSVLISFMFILEAISGVGGAFKTLPFSKALLATICASSTFLISTTLKKAKKSSFFNKKIRDALSNFGPAIGLVASTLFAKWALVTYGPALAGLPALDIPASFGTTSGRSWLVPLGALPVWARFASFVPALMATVLLFLSQDITVRLMNNPRWKLKKRPREDNLIDGMHGDMLVLSLLTAVQSVFGLPWMVAASVRSISHINALTIENEYGVVQGVFEQRVTGSLVHALMGACILLDAPRRWLSQLPLSVLIGLFGYLGVSSLAGVEMYERILDFFKDKYLRPIRKWNGKVDTKKVNIFTAIQIACLGTMFCVMKSPLGVLFPIIIATLAPIRSALVKSGLFTEEEMASLDTE